MTLCAVPIVAIYFCFPGIDVFISLDLKAELENRETAVFKFAPLAIVNEAHPFQCFKQFMHSGRIGASGGIGFPYGDRFKNDIRFSARDQLITHALGDMARDVLGTRIAFPKGGKLIQVSVVELSRNLFQH